MTLNEALYFIVFLFTLIYTFKMCYTEDNLRFVNREASLITDVFAVL